MELRLVIELATAEELAEHWRSHLSVGGAFVKGATAEQAQACVLVLCAPGRVPLELPARAVYTGPGGVGVQLEDFGPELRKRLQAWVEPESEPEPEPEAVHVHVHDHVHDHDGDDEDDEDDDDGAPKDPVARNVFERLRNLSVVDQLKCAREGEVHERMALERLYGKMVWEAILRNPRCTPHEVARIARKGQLPKPMIEMIVGNTAWLRVPEVRRALLGNPRLAAELIPRVLRLLPKHELRLVPNQTAYSSAVREAARRLIKD